MTEGVDWAVITEADIAMLEMAMRPGVEYVDHSGHYLDEEEDVD